MQLGLDNRIDMKTPIKHIDLLVSELCEEVDHYKNEAAYWKEKYEKERAENMKQLDRELEMAKKGVANALMFALAVKDSKNGDLVISKEDRKELANRIDV